jgi:hypothetical protein
MSRQQAKLLTVAANGQISIGKSWAGRQILVEELSAGEIRISSGTFIPDSQKVYFTPEATQSLSDFDDWADKNPPTPTDTKSLFSELRKKNHSRGK